MRTVWDPRGRPGPAEPAEPAEPAHDTDEVYYVLEGGASFLVEDQRMDVQPGSVLFVAKGKNHRFGDIAEDLSVLFFFATPGGSTT
jgi:mannose-6-phosphate isomerase-like protein (cupin superfamily)